MYVVSFLVIWVVLMFLVYLLFSDNLDVGMSLYLAMISLMFTVGLFVTNVNIQSEKDFQKCLEANKPIKAKVVYLSDSTEKIFKYTFENNPRQIEVKNIEAYFHVPESLI